MNTVKLKLIETDIPNDVSTTLGSKGYQLIAEHTLMVYNTLVTSMAKYLSIIKKKAKGPAAVIMRDLKGNFMMAAVAKYFPGAQDDMPGNWTMEFTFDAKDVEGIENIQETSSLPFTSMYDGVLFDLHSARCKKEAWVFDMTTVAISTLINWFDKNAEEGVVKELELPGFFVASVAVEEGEKVMSLVPDGSITRFIKDDLGESIAA